MPYTFNGFGTTYYGQRDAAVDGSYVTTLWVTALWVPLLPLGSYRVLPVGAGTNVVVYRSQSYQTLRVPLCWPQVRNVYLCVSPMLALVLYFGGSDIKNWWKEDILKSRSSQSALVPESPQVQPVEAELPLNSKDAAVACGKVYKLDEAAFVKLNIIERLSQLVADSGYTDQEIKDQPSDSSLDKEAFEAYSFAYLSWDKAEKSSRASFDKMVIDAANKVDKSGFSQAQRIQLDAYLVKYKHMMLKAFDLGRHDARISPCPYNR
jgi:hypothetical protein